MVFKNMSNFVPLPVTAALKAGSFDVLSELRHVTTLFLKLDTYCREKHRDLLTLQDFFFGAQEILSKSGGFMRQFLVDDKGFMTYLPDVCYDLPQNENDRGWFYDCYE
jgi:hypothetical protein